MTRNGIAYQLRPLEPLTDAIESGSLPTPVRTDAIGARNATARRPKGNGRHHAGTTLTDALIRDGDMELPETAIWPEHWPTPTARDHKDVGDLTKVPENGLLPRVVDRVERERLLPTPRAQDGKHAEATDYELSRRKDKDLLHVRLVRENWPTPTKADGPGGPGNGTRQGGENLRTAAGGSLNPTFVEWLMGYPKDWTVVE